MKFPKLPKLFKKKYIVIYVIIFLLIASVLVFYFYGSFRENAVTLSGPMDTNGNNYLNNTRSSEKGITSITNIPGITGNVELAKTNVPLAFSYLGNMTTNKTKADGILDATKDKEQKKLFSDKYAGEIAQKENDARCKLQKIKYLEPTGVSDIIKAIANSNNRPIPTFKEQAKC